MIPRKQTPGPWIRLIAFLGKIRRVVFLAIYGAIAAILIFALFEGLSSTVLFFHRVARTRPLAERRHTQYDEQLGWINIPNLYIEDMYGPGNYLRTNAQGFRNSQDFSVEVPPDRLRIICSGDSFTLGYGVNNDQTWCQRLMAKDDRLETVNMGQGGYGVDQAYLWYKRDGAKLKHDIQIFAFITLDFLRMQDDAFRGYGKPFLKVENGHLVITNVPVPKRFFFVPWLTQNNDAILQLKSVQLLSRLFFQRKAEADSGDGTVKTWAGPDPVLAKILESLAQMNKEKNSTLVLVYLPTQDLVSSELMTWRNNIRLVAEQQGILFFDLAEEFKDSPPEELAKLFIQRGTIDYTGAAGHYTADGNQYIADVLYERLLALPEISNRLAQLNPRQ